MSSAVGVSGAVSSAVGVVDCGGVVRRVSAMPEFGHWELVLGSSVSGLLGGGGMLAIPTVLVLLASGWESNVFGVRPGLVEEVFQICVEE